jgi:hypothetical protein
MNAKMRKQLDCMLCCLMAVVITVVLGGCTHKMEITNVDNYFSPPSTVSKKPLKIGVTSSSMGHPQDSKYVSAVVDALQKNNSIERVIYPYNQATHQDMVDAVVDISIRTRYDGKGSNFWVNWPGFLIFAPAVWGYGYTADIETQANIASVKDGKSQQITIPTNYEFRQADMGRTWTEVGWLEVGIIPLIGGMVFTGYDNDITGEFIKEVAPSYGPYVSKKIVETTCDCLGYR